MGKSKAESMPAGETNRLEKLIKKEWSRVMSGDKKSMTDLIKLMKMRRESPERGEAIDKFWAMIEEVRQRELQHYGEEKKKKKRRGGKANGDGG